MIPKPGKNESVMRTSGGLATGLTLSLLSTVGRIIGAAIGEQISSVAEANWLHMDQQMGDRKERSTELAV